MEQIFKLGDKVFHYEFGGWGEVIEEHNINKNPFPVVCRFPAGTASFTWDGRFYEQYSPTLSFTEYTLEGFSQERPEPSPNIGDIVWVRNEFPSEWEIGYFFKKEGNTYYTSASKNSQGWRSAGIEIRTTNPYENKES
jgi:hypothetical protein